MLTLKAKPTHTLKTDARLYVKAVSLRFNGHFPGESGIAGTRISPFWILLELRMMMVMVTTRLDL